MRSIQSVYKIGNGPSSSHTVGPYNASLLFRERYPDADRYEVTLYGSLAFTGEGHGTKKAILQILPDAVVLFDKETTCLPHPNTMRFVAIKDGEVVGDKRIFSIGGGSVLVEDEPSEDEDIYPEKNFSEIAAVCRTRGISLLAYIREKEGETLTPYLKKVWDAMQASVRRGLSTEGVLPGGLGVERKAKTLFEKCCYNESSDVTMNRLIAAYAFAVSEENASENVVVTAPTCGSSGVIPAVFYYMRYNKGFPEEEILDALAVAGLIGNIIRTNASISGAECGCQAEIGSACSMAAAGLASLYRLDLDKIEFSAETAMEHNLGLTCDPVKGLVQIPCIERNSVAALRAIASVDLSRFLSSLRKISLDVVIETMYRTGKDMDARYKETSHGGLAVMYEQKKTQA